MIRHFILAAYLVAFSILCTAQNLPNVYAVGVAQSANTYLAVVNNFNATGTCGTPYCSKIVFVGFNQTNTGAITLAISYNGTTGPAAGVRKYNGTAWVAMSSAEIDTKLVYILTYDNINGYWRQLSSTGGSGSSFFNSDITVVLAGGKTLGRYTNGQTIPASGKTAEEVINSLAIEYINPAFNSFNLNSLNSYTVEVGTTLGGSVTFSWSINVNSGSVSTIDIYNVSTSTTILSNTPNDGTQLVTVPSVQLNTPGATQLYRGVLHDLTIVQDINSNPVTYTARYKSYYGATASSPTNSAQVKALPSSRNHITGASNTWTFTSGTTLTKWVIALPPGSTLNSVIDTGNLNVDITSQFINTGIINVTDAGGTNRAYNIYEYNTGVPYPVSTTFSVNTTN